jgi:2-polyprenyl-3-methyl-5-hydroxy-6-metoxy-1,4-benzoquinol methylase
MTRRARTVLKSALLASVSRLTGRHAVLLPVEARDENSILDVHAPYRASSRVLTVHVREPAAGRLKATLLAYEGFFPTHIVWTGEAREYSGPCDLTLDLETGSVELSGSQWGRVALPLPGRRVCWRLEFTNREGDRSSRLTGHYLNGREGLVGRDYFHGTNYVDHEAQSAGDHKTILGLLQKHHARGRVLEIGCATGGLLATLATAGIEGAGIDVSEWAVGRARERLGHGRVWVCDVESDPVPPEVEMLGPFGALIFSAVLEHLGDPFTVLERLSRLASTGAVLIIITTNADGLGRVLFGPEWEGYFDWTHAGVDRVGVRTLREELPRLGWRIAELGTYMVWDSNADPTRATLRDWWTADGRFRKLLVERELGDLITCVAIRE